MYIQTARENKAIGGAFIMLVTIREREKPRIKNLTIKSYFKWKLSSYYHTVMICVHLHRGLRKNPKTKLQSQKQINETEIGNDWNLKTLFNFHAMLSEINFENATSSLSALWEFEYFKYWKN